MIYIASSRGLSLFSEFFPTKTAANETSTANRAAIRPLLTYSLIKYARLRYVTNLCRYIVLSSRRRFTLSTVKSGSLTHSCITRTCLLHGSIPSTYNTRHTYLHQTLTCLQYRENRSLCTVTIMRNNVKSHVTLSILGQF